jgi:hypothetical protein
LFFLLPLVPGPSPFEAKIPIAKLKKYELPDSDQILAELIHERGETLLSEVHVTNLIWKKEELPDQWKESIIVLIHKRDNKTDCSSYRGMSLLSTCHQNSGQNSDIKIANRSFENVSQFKYFGTTVTNHNLIQERNLSGD